MSEQRFEFGQKGWAWNDKEENGKPCILIDIDSEGSGLNFYCATKSGGIYDGLGMTAWFKNFSIEKPVVYKDLDQSVFDGVGNEVKCAVVENSGRVSFTSDPNPYTGSDSYWVCHNGFKWYKGKHKDDSTYKPMTMIKREFIETKPQIEGFEFKKIFKDEETGELSYIAYTTKECGDRVKTLSQCVDIPNFAGFWFKEDPKVIRNSPVAYLGPDGEVWSQWEPGAKVIHAGYTAFEKEDGK